MKNPKITVIGGSGFIGTHLCRLLASKDMEFEILDIAESKHFQKNFKFVDIRDLNSLVSAISGDVVVNLAAVHKDIVEDVNDYYKTNVDGAGNIINACNMKGIKQIVFTSSVAVYGAVKTDLFEKSQCSPTNDYGKSKLNAERIFRDWKSQDAENRLLIIRPTVVFGPGNKGNVYNLLKQIQSRRFIMVGGGTNKKSMAYVENLASFIQFCLDNKAEGTINYVDKPDIDMKTLVSISQDKLGIKPRFNFAIPYKSALLIGSVINFLKKYFGLNTSLSKERFEKFCATTVFSSNSEIIKNFKPPFTLYEGLNLTIEGEFKKDKYRL